MRSRQYSTGFLSALPQVRSTTAEQGDIIKDIAGSDFPFRNNMEVVEILWLIIGSPRAILAVSGQQCPGSEDLAPERSLA